MKEIGGYFGLEQLPDRSRYGDLVAVNNGRNALAYILHAKNVRKLYIPIYLCDCVEEVCGKIGCATQYYSIGDDFLPLFDRELGKDEWLYVVNYFGQISNAKVQELKDRYGNVIFDNVQAFFQEPVPGIDTVYSCRKFFGVPDGGYAATDSVLHELQTDVSRERMTHVLGRFEGQASDFYSDFQECERTFSELPLRAMSKLTKNILSSIDYEAVRRKRSENYQYLAKILGPHNRLNLFEPVGPYCYPFYCENGMQLKKTLARQKIFVPTLWPNVLRHEGTLEKDYAENILPLPCDQRYGREDMQAVVEAILTNMQR